MANPSGYRRAFDCDIVRHMFVLSVASRDRGISRRTPNHCEHAASSWPWYRRIFEWNCRQYWRQHSRPWMRNSIVCLMEMCEPRGGEKFRWALTSLKKNKASNQSIDRSIKRLIRCATNQSINQPTIHRLNKVQILPDSKEPINRPVKPITWPLVFRVKNREMDAIFVSQNSNHKLGRKFEFK